MSEPDRVSYSLGMKVGLPNFSSCNFNISLSSDLKEGETPEKALKRVQKIVEKEAEEKYADIIESQKD